MSERLQAGTVWINNYRSTSFTTPFGGYKDSGLGREGGMEAVKEFMETKSVWISTDRKCRTRSSANTDPTARRHIMSTAHSADSFDVIVIGCGISGLSAAVAAAGRGVSVAVIERATREESGGNTRWTEAYFRMKSDTEVSDDFDELLSANAGDNLDPDVIRSMAAPYEDWPPSQGSRHAGSRIAVDAFEPAGPTVQWLKSFGIRFDALPTYFVTAAAPA